VTRLTPLLVLVSALSACASAPEVVKLKPPVDLLQDCPHPTVATATNGDLARGILAYREALTLCNNDKAALREWDKE
jgi:hypothetical protein